MALKRLVEYCTLRSRPPSDNYVSEQTKLVFPLAENFVRVYIASTFLVGTYVVFNAMQGTFIGISAVFT